MNSISARRFDSSLNHLSLYSVSYRASNFIGNTNLFINTQNSNLIDQLRLGCSRNRAPINWCFSLSHLY